MILSNRKNWFHLFFYFGLVALVVAVSANAALAQGKGKKKKTSAHSETQKPVILIEANASSSSNSENKTASTKSSNIYIQSLRDLLVVREREVDVAKENLNKTKQLFAEGIVSKRAVEEAEVALADAQTKADDIRRKIASYESPTETKDSTEETAETKADKTTTGKVIETEAKKPSVKSVVQTRPKTSKKKTSKKITKAKSN